MTNNGSPTTKIYNSNEDRVFRYGDIKPTDIKKVFVVKSGNASSDDRNIYTISPSKNKLGWETDMGIPGYGLPKEVAMFYAKTINEALHRQGLLDLIEGRTKP